jgi:hypothetical protein
MQLSETRTVLALPPLLICILCVNLWFTENRLRSSARICGYIGVALEPGSRYPWVGWENALRLYRKWVKTYDDDVQASRINKIFDHTTTPRGMRYYSLLVALHVVPVVFAMIASTLTLCNGADKIKIAMVLLTAAAAAYFANLAAGRLRPDKVTHLVEYERSIWELVFGDRYPDLKPPPNGAPALAANKPEAAQIHPGHAEEKIKK